MLKGWNGCSLARISSLASLSLESLKKSLKNQRKGVRGLVLGLGAVLVRNEQERERESEGVREVFIPHTQETSRWLKGTRILRVKCPDTPDTRTIRAVVRTIRTQHGVSLKDASMWDFEWPWSLFCFVCVP